jgi:hypothetical protein
LIGVSGVTVTTFFFITSLIKKVFSSADLLLCFSPKMVVAAAPSISLSLNNPTSRPSSTTGIWRMRPNEITSLAKSNVSSGFSVTGEPVMISLTTPSLPFFMLILL